MLTLTMDNGVLAENEINSEKRSLKMGELWDITGNKLRLVLIMENFVEAINTVNRIAQEAEILQHHPDLHIFSYKNLKIEIYTHQVNGLTKKDFELARRIEKVL